CELDKARALTYMSPPISLSLLFFFTYPATTEFYPLSLHDALPIYVFIDAPPLFHRGDDGGEIVVGEHEGRRFLRHVRSGDAHGEDRKSTRLNSSHVKISYAVFCLKKKKNKYKHMPYMYNQ